MTTLKEVQERAIETLQDKLGEIRAQYHSKKIGYGEYASKSDTLVAQAYKAGADAIMEGVELYTKENNKKNEKIVEEFHAGFEEKLNPVLEEYINTFLLKALQAKDTQAYTAGMMAEAEHTEQYIKEAREDEKQRIIKIAGDYMNEVDHHNFVKNL